MSRLRTRGCCPRGTPGGIWPGPFPTITTHSPPLRLPPGSPSVPLWPPFPVLLATRSRGVGWPLLRQPRMPLKGQIGAADCRPHPIVQGDRSLALTDMKDKRGRGHGTRWTWAGAKGGAGVPCRPSPPRPPHRPHPPACTRHSGLPVLPLRAVSPLALIPTWLHSLRRWGGGRCSPG